jgi:hypothetical protein
MASHGNLQLVWTWSRAPLPPEGPCVLDRVAMSLADILKPVQILFTKATNVYLFMAMSKTFRLKKGFERRTGIVRPSFLTSALGEGQWSASHSGHITPLGKEPSEPNG